MRGGKWAPKAIASTDVFVHVTIETSGSRDAKAPASKSSLSAANDFGGERVLEHFSLQIWGNQLYPDAGYCESPYLLSEYLGRR